MTSGVTRPADFREVAEAGLGLIGSGIAGLVATGDPAFAPVPLPAEYAAAAARFRG